ncbi:MAG: HD-GYP domain-containing protein [Peptococcaceae bacterium]
MKNEVKVSLFEVVMGIANTVDLISPSLVNHHKQVAYLAYCIAEELNLPKQQRDEIVLAAALHDIGAISLKERIDALHFEVINPNQHALNGHALLSSYPPLGNVADIIKYHHVRWDDKRADEVPLGSHIVHLADRIAVSINNSEHILGQIEDIYQKIHKQKGLMFMPELVDSFADIFQKEYLWLNAASQHIEHELKTKIEAQYPPLDMDDLPEFTRIFSRIIDFRSSFTAKHSGGVAAVSELLAAKLSFDQPEQKMIRVAGFLHDLGKLAIPKEILEKPGKLTRAEFNIIKTHTYYTYQTLSSIRGLETINKWASFHHERPDGNGYPFHLKEAELPLGSRILAVADVYTALTEDRPYRQGMNRDETLKVLTGMGREKALDEMVIEQLIINYEEIAWQRISAQEGENTQYKLFTDKKELNAS